MASETTFGHWKVVFSWGKGRKMTFSQNLLIARFWASGFWMSILSSANFKKDPPWYIFSLSVHAPATSVFDSLFDSPFDIIFETPVQLINTNNYNNYNIFSTQLRENFTRQAVVFPTHHGLFWFALPRSHFLIRGKIELWRPCKIGQPGLGSMFNRWTCFLLKILGRVYLYLKQKIRCGRELILYIECKMQNLKISKLERKNCKQCESVCGISS